jgi:hypothetical protein
MNNSSVKLFRIQSIEIVQCQTLKKNPTKYTFRRFFQQKYQSTLPRHFSSQHIGDLGQVANLLQGTQVLSF